MSDEHKKAREQVAKHARIWVYWDEGGSPCLLLNLIKPDGTPSSTVGSCKLRHADEYMGMLLRGLECGAVLANRDS
jgi:hypothetical protein